MVTWKKTLTATIVGCAVFGLGVVYGQPRKARTLTTQDYIDIQQLVSRYAYALDGGLNQGKAYADLFTEDGSFHDQHGKHWRGRAELLTIANKSEETPNNVGHFIMNHVIEPTADGAVGKQYLITVSPFGEEQNGRRASSIGAYHYEDVYERTSAGWRFKSRTVIEKPAGAARPAAR